jgi:nucleoside-diphosphate-sugar epimerase
MSKLLLTGSNGFLGKSILSLLRSNGYAITTLDVANADINSNLSKEIPCFLGTYDVVLHAAGKAHAVPKNAAEANVFFDVNLKGTQRLCAGLEKTGLPRSFVFISTVAVYGCEAGENITENYPLNGSTPYALSKIQAEQFLVDWAKKNNVTLTIFRPSLIAGKNPPGNLGTMVNGIKSGKYLSIGGGKAKKSVLMADDIAILIAKASSLGGVYNVCDNHNSSFHELEQLIAQQLNKKFPKSIPYWMAKSVALMGDLLGSKAPLNSEKLDKITKSLTFSNQKAREMLNWEPLDVLSNFKIS